MMWGGGWWLFGAVVMVVCIFLMGRMMMGHGGSGHEDHGGTDRHGETSSAGEILAARFARGEISEEEFEQRKRVLEGRSRQARPLSRFGRDARSDQDDPWAE